MSNIEPGSLDVGPTTIVVGVDASPESLAAVAWARQIAGPDDRIDVVHSWDIPIVTGYDIAVVVDPVEIEQGATEFLDGLIAELDDDRLHAVASRGHTGRALVDAATDASMVVVGHRGSSRLSLVLGSTANYVLHHTKVPTVIIRGDQLDGCRSVVVGADDHDVDAECSNENESVRALRWAYGLPGVQEIKVVHSWFLPALVAGRISMLALEIDEMDEAANAVIDRVVRAAGPAPDSVKVIREAVRGTPGFALIEASRSADLVIVGSRGRGGFAELVLGSTCAEVVSHAHSPVAVIH